MSKLDIKQQRTLENLKRLIDHPATSNEERAAARLAVARLLKIEQEELARIKAQSSSLAAIFKKRMNSR